MNKENTGVDETFERFVANNYKRIFNYIFMIANDYEMAKDLTQETFLKAARGYTQLRRKDRLDVWTFRIARNTTFSRLKKEQRRRSKFISLFTKRYEGELIDSISDPAQAIDEAVAKHEERSVVRKVLNELPPRMKEALILKEWENLSYEEIGGVMKVSKKAVKSLLHRARVAMRKRLEKEDVFK
jgi:RNA polymerase sigma-70 factor (ECF subfamily)